MIPSISQPRALSIASDNTRRSSQLPRPIPMCSGSSIGGSSGAGSLKVVGSVGVRNRKGRELLQYRKRKIFFRKY